MADEDKKTAPTVTTKKTAGKKAPAKKAAAKKTVAKKAASKKKVAAKKTASKKTVANTASPAPSAANTAPAPVESKAQSVSAEERWNMIKEAAYYKAEKRGFTGGDTAKDWAEAEKEIDAMLKEQGRV